MNLVKTNETSYETGSDYINASLITNVLDGYYKYIAAQGPTKDTIVDFIRMLVQFKVKIVLCACNEYEGQKVCQNQILVLFFNFCFSSSVTGTGQMTKTKPFVYTKTIMLL